MSSVSHLSKKILVASVFSCLVTSTAILAPLNLFSPLAQAQSRRVVYVPPSDLDAPKTSASGITRSSGCLISCLIALVPNLEINKNPVPRTISERPIIYFLSPKHRGSVRFRLYEDSAETPNKPIYQTSFDINNDAGIIAFKLPEDAPTLAIGKIYSWEFTVLTATNKTPYGSATIPDNKTVYGSVRRILPTKKLTEQLSKLSKPIDRAALFAQESLWFETLTTLADAQRTVPKSSEVTDEWIAILKSASLDRVLSYAFVSQK
ncbi:DUF928 domain-containing protein [Pseudanabaena sp. Chao 1811]|uniref:DUF928 domain-containing protein n=1 Tax=Pseudanabaena sp. Chao 1811 TaxID=2963092 RepID=UPI0022F3CF31|nr:DUF928 domain-containing protein [Pseudanabaena sp. Chao 1811]